MIQVISRNEVRCRRQGCKHDTVISPQMMMKHVIDQCTSSRNYTCLGCWASFETKKLLKIHKQSPDNHELLDFYECGQSHGAYGPCALTFKTVDELLRHVEAGNHDYIKNDPELQDSIFVANPGPSNSADLDDNMTGENDYSANGPSANTVVPCGICNTNEAYLQVKELKPPKEVCRSHRKSYICNDCYENHVISRRSSRKTCPLC